MQLGKEQRQTVKLNNLLSAINLVLRRPFQPHFIITFHETWSLSAFQISPCRKISLTETSLEWI